MRGRVLSGRYELVDKLGAGGMGEVWRARDRDLGREVAVKIFSPPEDVQDEERAELLGRFRREARAAAALDSPHIATIYDHGAHDGVPYLVMELVEGRSLEQVVRDDGRVPVGQALDWAVQVCRALGTAHAAGVVHRDIKPANVMVRPDGTAVVLDFGIAKFQEAVESESRLTRTGHMPLGSVLYMAPERFRMEAGDGREDLYAVGCVLYELLIGRPPFVGPAAGVMYNHLNDVPLRPSRARAELSVHVDRLILDLMAKDPDDRPADAETAEARLTELREETVPEPEPEPEPEPGPEPEPDPEPEDAAPPAPRPAPAPARPLPLPARRSRTPGRVLLTVSGALLALVVGTGVTLMATNDEPEPDYTVVYARPAENRGADDAAVEKIVREGVSSNLHGTVAVTPVDSTTLELEDKVKKLPNVVAVIGDTDLSPGLTGEDAQGYSSGSEHPPLVIDACPQRGSLGGDDPAADNTFLLRPSPAATAEELAGRLSRSRDTRSVVVVTSTDDDSGFSDRLSEYLSDDNVKVSEYHLTGDITDESRDVVAGALKKAEADTILLPQSPYEGVFTAGGLRKAGFRGKVVAPMASTCYGKQDHRAGPEGGGAKGVEHFRYRDLDLGPGLGRKVARNNDLDAARALARTLRLQSGSPDPDILRSLMGENLKTTGTPGATGGLAFDRQGFLKDRHFEIDRYGDKRWREVYDLTSR